MIDDERIYYDNSTTPAAPRPRATSTKVEELAGFDATGAPTYQTTYTAAYDADRPADPSTDARSGTHDHGLHARAAGPVTKAVVTQANGHTTTDRVRAGLGRGGGDHRPPTDSGPRSPTTRSAGPTKVWLPGRARTEAPEHGVRLPSCEADGPGVVTTKTLQTDGSFETTIRADRRPAAPAADAGGRARWRPDRDGLHLRLARQHRQGERPVLQRRAAQRPRCCCPREEELPTQKVIELRRRRPAHRRDLQVRRRRAVADDPRQHRRPAHGHPATG